MNKDFLDVLQRNQIYVQRHFYDSLSYKHLRYDGHIIGYNRIDDENIYPMCLKIRKTTMNIDVITRELKKKNFNIIFIQKTEYINDCNNMIDILFTYAKIKRNNNNKFEKWFKFNHRISISNIIMSLIIMMNAQNDVYIPQHIKQYNYSTNENKIISNIINDVSDDEEFFNNLTYGLGALIADVFMKENNNTPSLVKQGISVEILESILLENDESPMYYYTSGKNHILLTDKRFIKIEKYCVCSSIYLSNIKFVNHIKNSIFCFDKIQIIEESNVVETFDIYEREVSTYFTDLLNIIIKKFPKKVIKKNKCLRCLDKTDGLMNIDICMQCLATLKNKS